MQHRLVEQGRSSTRLARSTNFFAGCGLVPLTVSIGLGSYVVVERHFGLAAGLAVGLALASAAAFAWFGIEIIVGLQKDDNSMQVANTPLATRVEQLLTEARLIIPGAQALLGFQFIAMLTSGFDRLPQSVKAVHALALCLVAINVILLMTPAALHRLSFNGEDSQNIPADGFGPGDRRTLLPRGRPCCGNIRGAAEGFSRCRLGPDRRRAELRRADRPLVRNPGLAAGPA